MADLSNIVTKNYNRYFIYSVEQMKIRREVENKLGRELSLGTVIIQGESKPYTEMVTDLANVRYSDAVIVAYGDIREMNYTVSK